uniref:C-type lectin domain-containing protein n=1 Tax=Haemonchus placei TaxID=6290 RepID=A0A0N4WAF7_HAEPC
LFFPVADGLNRFKWKTITDGNTLKWCELDDVKWCAGANRRSPEELK